MTHESARERLLDLACGELSGRDAARVEAHAAGCEVCRAELAELRETRRLMAGLEEIPAPERGEAELLAAARSAAAARPRPWRVPAWFLGASAAAALVTVTAVSYRLLTTAPAQREDPEALLGRAPAAAQGGQAPAAVASKEASGPGAAPASGKRSQPAPARSPEHPATAAAPNPGPGAAAPAPRPPKATVIEADAATRKDETRRAAEEVAPSPGVEGSRGTETSVGVSEARVRSGSVEQGLALRAPAVPPAAGVAPAPARTGGPRAAAAVARVPAEAGGADAVARWQGLRAGGDLRREVVTFPDCPGESWREVDTDPRGRVVRYVRHGLAGGVPFEAELYYTDDGALGAVRYREAHGAWRELRLLGAPGPAAHVPAPAIDPARAGDAAASAPARCRF